MKNLISTPTKKNARKVQQKLQAVRVNLAIPGLYSGEINGADALAKGHQLLAESKSDEALCIANALLCEIDDIVDIYLLKARALLNQEAFYELQLLVEPLVKAARRNHGVSMVAARFYYATGKAQASLEFLHNILKEDPQNIEALLQMELCYRYSGDTKKAARILERCLAIAEPGRDSSGEQFKQYSTALFRLANYALLDDSKFAYLEAVSSSATDLQLKITGYYALAKQYNKKKDQKSEIRYLIAAKKHERKLLGMELGQEDLAARYGSRLSAQQSHFASADTNYSIEQDTDCRPVFVLGLPRSGTTLLEQILSSHSDVGQVGESKAFLGALKRASRKVNPIWNVNDYPASLKKLPGSSLQEIVRDYHLHQAVLTDKLIYIDKELANFEYVGLMAKLFPQSLFIHMDRAPMDIFLSCFRNSIPGVPETTDLVAMAEYYVYMKKLIGHWRSLYPQRFLIINYQSLVHEPERFARDASQFLGIGFEASMLDFHERKNIVRTLSVDQVRKKVYTDSVDGWREYSEVLGSARTVLERYNIPLEGVSYL